mmetsp:Transcript_80063/g.244792  ORF Transcript_80063/g.244792 Transcript_80063/m.244792 type:complete len:478 (+) Transcript_80063:238-1671(+)
MDVHQPEIHAVAQRHPREDVPGARAADRPPQAHRQVADVIEVTREAPPARGEQVAALLGVDVLHGLPPHLVLAEVATVGDVRAEIVLLDVRDSEEIHRQDVDGRPDGEVHVVVGQRLLEPGDVAAEGEAIVPHEEAEVPVGEHPAEEVVANVCRRQVRRLVPIVIKDVIPMGERHHAGRHTDARPIARLRALGLAGRGQVATEIHRRNVRLVPDHPQREPWPGVPEALEVEGHRQEAVEEPGVAGDPQPPVVDALAVVEDAPILLELRVVDVAPPQEPEVDVQPRGHGGRDDHPAGEQGAHVRPNEVGAEVAEPTQGVWDDVRQDECRQSVHGVLQLVPVLERDPLHDLRGDEDLQCRLEDDPHGDRDEGLRRRPDRDALGEREVKVVPELGVPRDRQVAVLQDATPIEVPNGCGDEERPEGGAKVASELADGPSLRALDELAVLEANFSHGGVRRPLEAGNGRNAAGGSVFAVGRA